MNEIIEKLEEPIILDIQNITKKYGSITAVENLSMQVHKGDIYGILGPNGSGKTTTLGIIMGIIRQKQGNYTWFGQKNSADARKRIGVLLETPNFYPYMDAVDNLKIVAHIKNVKSPQIENLLKLVNLSDRKHSAFKTYSLGMKQRLAIAAALIGDPEVLIFDEPTNGLDPEGIAEVRELIIKIAERGKTIIMASHILDEVEKICTHVAILKYGDLLMAGSVEKIMNQDKTVEIRAKDMRKLQEILKNCKLINSWEVQKSVIVLTLQDGFNAEDLNHFVFEEGLSLSHLVVKQRSLEEQFLEITRDLN